jgi:hypothetical protein
MRLQYGVVQREIILNWNSSQKSICISFGVKMSQRVSILEPHLSHQRRSGGQISFDLSHPLSLSPPLSFCLFSLSHSVCLTLSVSLSVSLSHTHTHQQPLFLKELSKVFDLYPSYNYTNTVLLENHLEKFEVSSVSFSSHSVSLHTLSHSQTLF